MKHSISKPCKCKKTGHDSKTLKIFQNLYLFPIDLQHLLKKTLKKTSSSNKRAFLSFIYHENFNINSDDYFHKNLQKIQLLTTLQEKQIGSLVKKPIIFEKTKILEAIDEIERNQEDFNKKCNFIENIIEEKEVKTPVFPNIAVFEENIKLYANLNEKNEKSCNSDDEIKLEYSEELEFFNKSTVSNSDFNDISTKDDGYFDVFLENLDISSNFSQNAKNNDKNEQIFQFGGKIMKKKLLASGEIKDFTDLIGENNVKEALMDKFLNEERGNNFENS